MGIVNYIDERNFYKKIIGVDIPEESSIVVEKYTHVGFHGDGEYLDSMPRYIYNGAYYFRDRYAKNYSGDSGVGVSHSYDKKILYIYVLDT